MILASPKLAPEIPPDVAAIFDDPAFDSETHESTRAEAIEKLIPELGWPSVEEAMLGLLARSDEPNHWRVAAEVLWGATLDGRKMQIDRVIAHLYLRHPPGDGEDNLVWSIASRLKGRGYLSDYDPLRDPDVVRELTELERDRPRERTGA